MRHLLIKWISLYQKNISAKLAKTINLFGLFRNNSCVFYPTCSDYAKLAIEKYGVLKGLWLALRRILRCHPWQKNHIDPLL